MFSGTRYFSEGLDMLAAINISVRVTLNLAQYIAGQEFFDTHRTPP